MHSIAVSSTNRTSEVLMQGKMSLIVRIIMTPKLSLEEHQPLLILNQISCCVLAQKIICYVGKYVRI